MYPNEGFCLAEEHCLIEWMPSKIRIASGIDVTVDDSDGVSPVLEGSIAIVAKKNTKKEVKGFNSCLVNELIYFCHRPRKGWTMNTKE